MLRKSLICPTVPIPRSQLSSRHIRSSRRTAWWTRCDVKGTRAANGVSKYRYKR